MKYLIDPITKTFSYIKKQFLKILSFLYNSNIFPWIIISFGIVLRISQYLFNRSLWLDESMLALNIINRSFSQLLKPLDYNQGAPIGFLMVEKLLIQAFGSSEYILRLFPFLCGVISLFLFCKVATYYIRQNATLIALFLFAITDSLIYYSSECKQYSSDVFIALVLYTVTIYIQSKRLTTSRIALFGVIGAIAIWLSHPSVFILAGIGLSLTLSYLSKKELLKIGKFSIICSIWVLSFAASYFVSLRNLSHNKSLLNYWRGSFMPFPLEIKWFSVTLSDFLKMPMGLSSFPSIVVLTFLIGCVSIFLKKREEFFGLISPIFFTLLASALRKYAISGRLLLFIIPIILIFIAEGVEKIGFITNNYSAGIVIILVGLLILNPLISSSLHLVKPRTHEEIKPVLAYIRENKQSGDLIYLYYASRVAFKYYSENYGFKDNDYIVGVSSRYNPEKYIDDLDKLHGNKRVWILFSHVHQDEERFFLDYLNSMGKRIDSFKSIGASVYLYDLSRKN